MYVLHDRMASDVNFKLFYFVPDVFFLKETTALLVVLEGRHLQLQFLPTGGTRQQR